MTPTRRHVVLLVLLTLVWGCNWPIMKLSLREVSPLWFRALTVTGGVFVLAALVMAFGHRLRPTPREVPAIVAVALPNMVGWHLFSIIGLAELAAGRAGILGFTMPVWALLFAAMLFGQRLTRGGLLAALCALAAVALLTSQELAAFAGRPAGIVWMQAAAASWALGTVLLRRQTMAMSAEALTVWMMVIAAIAFWIVAFAFEPLPRPAGWSAVTWWTLVYGVLINFGIAQAVWSSIARELPPQVSTFSVMAVPVVGVVAAIFVVGEVPHWFDWLAAAFIVAAIALANLTRGKAAPEPEKKAA